MKKMLSRLLLVVSMLVVVFIIARLTGMLQMYTTPTEANEPSIHLSDLIWTSNLKSPKQFDFIVFDSDQQPFSNGKKNAFIYRLIGLPGHVIEIKNGICFINGINADIEAGILYSYNVPVKFAASLRPDEEIDFGGQDSVLVQLSEATAKKAGLKHFLDTTFNPAIQERWQRPWSTDNFGPITVPADHYFVMGDNRNNASDSRYIGFVPAKDWRGTVLNKH
jgi:signal peptidase I